jgi:thiamine kinase-like enzyme
MGLNLNNIILTTNDEVAVIDWSTAMFYPEKFELAMLSVSDKQYLLTDEDTRDDLDLNKLRAVDAMSTCNYLWVYLFSVIDNHNPSADRIQS